MEIMTVKELKKLIEPIDDSAHVKIMCCDWHDVEKVLIEYIREDDYQIPCVILKTGYDAGGCVRI